MNKPYALFLKKSERHFFCALEKKIGADVKERDLSNTLTMAHAATRWFKFFALYREVTYMNKTCALSCKKVSGNLNPTQMSGAYIQER